MPELLPQVSGEYERASKYTLCFGSVKVGEDKGMRYMGCVMRAKDGQKRQSKQAESLVGRPGGQSKSCSEENCLEDARDSICSMIVYLLDF